MNEQSCHRTVERLLNRLERSRLVKHLELSDEDIADAIWLALQMGVVEAKKEEGRSDDQRQEPLIIDDREEIKDEDISKEEPPINVYSQDATTQESESQTTSKGLPFQAPAAAALQNKLPISRALRPLMRKVPSTIRKIVDAEATVTRIAERNIWLPVTKPEPERWLQLELVVEESRSSFIWTETIDELQKLLQNHGAFRTVRVWSLSSTDNNHLQLTRRRKGSQTSHCQHSYRELIPSNRRALILLISDCVSSIWQQEKIYQWLQEWSNKVPTAIVQLLPERLWQSSELGLGDKLPFSAFEPGVPNSELVLPSLWEELKGKQILKLPVITLEDFSIENWAKVVAGRGSIRTPGFVLDLKFVAEQVERKLNVNPQEISPENLVDRFLATASPTAQRLAGLMAAAPVSLPVVNLIQKTFLLNQSTPVNVAEVFLSGMIQRTDVSDKRQNPQYDFVPEVRKILNQAMRLDETENVLDVVSSYIAENLGLSIKSFTALLLRHQDLSQEQQEQILPFARVTIEVLQNLGGEYADFAKEVAGKIGVLPPTTLKPEEEKPPEPALKTCTFEVATIEIEETRTFTFEFIVATLERQSLDIPPLGNEGGQGQQTVQWLVKRQKQQATGIIEVLEEGIELELMEIPEGTFMMGSPAEETDSYDDERPQHEVHVPSFYMSRYPITQAQWKAIASDTSLKVERELEPEPSRFKDTYQDYDRWSRPVESISWYDAKEFCARLSKKTKRTYRLPTEAEWEYACRAVTSYQLSVTSEESIQNPKLVVSVANPSKIQNLSYPPFHFGETITTDLANYRGTDDKGSYGDGPKGEYRGQTTPVGYFQVANTFGLYDMHGLVWEWCEDDWHSNYEGAPTDGSAWVSNDSSTKVVRGGSWYRQPGFCRSAFRDLSFPAYVGSLIGLRVVCGLPRTQ